MEYRFGKCVLDGQLCELRVGGAPVHVEPQVFDVLRYLVEKRDCVVSRDELVDAIWHGRSISDATVAARIWAARQAIGDSGEAQEMIATVRRRGFRFVAPVACVSTNGELSHHSEESPGAAQVAEDLGVRYIVEGSLRRDDDRARVTVQLVDALSGQVLWSDRYERTADDFLAVEEEITARIAHKLDLRIIYGTEQAGGGTKSLDAWAAFVQGRTEYLKFTSVGNARARELYQRAIEIDPSFAEAMMALANTYFVELIGMPSELWATPLAEIAKLDHRAAQIAPRMPRLFDLRSMMAMVEGDYARALAEAEAMAEADPNSAESHYVLGRMRFFMRDYEGAIDSLSTAERINPHSRASYSTHLAFSHLALGRTDVAVSILETVAERWPEYAATPAYLAIAYQLAGRKTEAERQAALLPHVAPGLSMLAIERRFAPMQDRPLADRIITAAREAGIPH